MHLTGENIKKFILSSSNVPFSIPQVRIKLGDQDFILGNRIRSVIRTGGDTIHIRHSTLIEFSHDTILKDVTAFDLTSSFIFLPITGVDANDVGEAVGVGDAFREGKLALVQQTESDGLSVSCEGRFDVLDRSEGVEGDGEGYHCTSDSFSNLSDEVVRWFFHKLVVRFRGGREGCLCRRYHW